MSANQSTVSPIDASPLSPDPQKPTKDPSPVTVLIFGRDDRGRPHASRFSENSAAAAREAAALMGMSIQHVDSEPLRALADKLPQGKIFPSGKAFVPFVSREVYDQIVTHAPATAHQAAESSQEATAATPPPTSGRRLPDEWSTIKKGSVVLAVAAPEDGWWEAVVTEDRGDDLFILKWRDWSDLPKIVRKRDQLALLPPSLACPGGV